MSVCVTRAHFSQRGRRQGWRRVGREQGVWDEAGARAGRDANLVTEFTDID